MNEKDKIKNELRKIIKTGVEQELEKYDEESVSDEEMISSNQPLPPEEIWEKLKKEIN